MNGPTCSGETQVGTTWFLRTNTGRVAAAATTNVFWGVQVDPRQLLADRAEAGSGITLEPLQPSDFLKAGGVSPWLSETEVSIHR
jgi:hypothetical protein